MKNQSSIILKITFFNHVKSIFWFLIMFSAPIVGVMYSAKMDVQKRVNKTEFFCEFFHHKNNYDLC